MTINKLGISAAVGKHAVLAIAFWAICASVARGDNAPVRVALLGFDLINTSLEPVSAAEKARLRMLDEQLQEKLAASDRYRVVTIPPALQDKIDAQADIRNCNGCERDFGRAAGADLAIWGTVQKVSNLILNINLYIENVESGQLTFVKSVDIRGNTDESWRHGLSYMLRHYLLKDD